MKVTLSPVLGWVWIVAVLYLYVVERAIRLRPPGLLGDLLKSFFEAMTASYLH